MNPYRARGINFYLESSILQRFQSQLHFCRDSLFKKTVIISIRNNKGTIQIRSSKSKRKLTVITSKVAMRASTA